MSHHDHTRIAWTGADAKMAPDHVRYLGFRTVRLSVHREHRSHHTSFHQLGYCISGRALLFAAKGEQFVGSVVIGAGDFFFVPAGADLCIRSGGDTAFTIASAVCSDDQLTLAQARSHRSTVNASMQTLSYQRCADLDDLDDAIAAADHDPDGHLVLFYDTRTESLRAEHTVRSAFDRKVLAREFAIDEASIPALNMGLISPVVICARPNARGH